MDTIIQNALKYLKKANIIHIIILSMTLIFNLVILSLIYWLAQLVKFLYFIGIISSIILFIIPIISLIFICLNKLKKNNLNIFKVITIIGCVLTISLGFFFSGLLMINAIESPEFCKECPFNLPIEEVNKYFENDFSTDKCKPRRCVINSKNYETLEKNEDNLYEYLCNYDPTPEFDEIKETNDDISFDINNIETNNTTEKNSDNIICTKIDSEKIIMSDFENNYVFSFYNFCHDYVDFYICERNEAPNKYKLKDNSECPGTNYMTILIVYCMINIALNLIANFVPLKYAYNKYDEMTTPLRPNNRKSDSFNSTFNSSKIPKENIESEEKFEPSPTEIIIVYGNKNNNKNNINNINNLNNNNNKNKIDINNNNINIENNIDNELVVQKARSKKLNMSSIGENKIVKNKLDFKSSKNLRLINQNISIMKKKEKEKLDEEMKDKRTKYNENDNKITLSNDENTIVSTKRIILSDNTNSEL